MKGASGSEKDSYFLLFDRSGTLKEIDEGFKTLLTSDMDVIDFQMKSKNHSFLVLEDSESSRTIMVEVRYFEQEKLLCFNQLCEKDRNHEDTQFIDHIKKVFSDCGDLTEESKELVHLDTQLNNIGDSFKSVSFAMLVRSDFDPQPSQNTKDTPEFTELKVKTEVWSQMFRKQENQFSESIYFVVKSKRHAETLME